MPGQKNGPNPMFFNWGLDYFIAQECSNEYAWKASTKQSHKQKKQKIHE